MNYEYRTLSEAYTEAEERLRDGKLQRATSEYLGGVWPPSFDRVTDPAMIMAPYLATASRSEIRFQEVARNTGLEAMIATYRQACFVTANPGVVACYRPPLKLPKGQYRRTWVVAPENRSGEIAPADTIYSCDIEDYWQGIRAPVYEENQIPIRPAVDFSEWYDFQACRFGWAPGDRNKAPAYYMALMALYASGRAVLYDSPPTAFFERVMQPAINQAISAFGEEPIIVCGPEIPSTDWVDLTFLEQSQAESLIEKGRL